MQHPYCTTAIPIQSTLYTPEPVKAMPMMSRPARMAGVACIWMGVGLLMPLRSSTCGCMDV